MPFQLSHKQYELSNHVYTTKPIGFNRRHCDKVKSQNDQKLTGTRSFSFIIHNISIYKLADYHPHFKQYNVFVYNILSFAQGFTSKCQIATVCLSSRISLLYVDGLSLHLIDVYLYHLFLVCPCSNISSKFG